MGEKVIVRSSALAEKFNTANAGAFESILDVDSASTEALENAIGLVISSYSNRDAKDQVLVQPMIESVKGSGVIFTRVLQNGAPYYVINYDDQSQSTASVTSGTSLDFKTYKILRSATQSRALPNEIKNLLKAVGEIEGLFGHDRLDIEFAIDEDSQVVILQVRPIVVENNNSISIDKDIAVTVQDGKYFSASTAYPSNLRRENNFWLNADWDPAEIIGVRPNRLSADLYDKLIMTDIWARQRAEYGYRDVRPFGLMNSLVNPTLISELALIHLSRRKLMMNLQLGLLNFI